MPHIFESLQTSDVIRLGNIDAAPRLHRHAGRRRGDAARRRIDPLGCRVFNVGTGVAYSVQDIVEALGRILGRAITVVQEPSRVRATERMLLVADIEKIRAADGVELRGLSLDDTLQDLVAAYGLEPNHHSAIVGGPSRRDGISRIR